MFTACVLCVFSIIKNNTNETALDNNNTYTRAQLIVNAQFKYTTNNY